MAWTASNVFRQMMADILTAAQVYDLDTDAYKAALYNNTPTPSKDVVAANTVYNVDQWVTANEVFQAGQWAQGGVALASLSVTTPSSGIVQWNAANTASGGAATLANVYGCLVYNTTRASKGICFNYFGGTTGVASGTYTVVWPGTGIAQWLV